MSEDQLRDLSRRFPHLEELVVARSTAARALEYWHASTAPESTERVAEFAGLVASLTDELQSVLEGINTTTKHSRRKK